MIPPAALGRSTYKSAAKTVSRRTPPTRASGFLGFFLKFPAPALPNLLGSENGPLHRNPRLRLAAIE
jgi:hypothetical protein